MFQRVLVICLFSALALWGGETINLGFTRLDAAQRQQEFELYDKLSAFYRTNGLRTSLLEYRYLIDTKYSVEELAAELKKNHVVLVQADDEGIFTLTEEKRQHAIAVGKVLADYVKNGGGLVIEPRSVRYPGNDDETYWNLIYQPFGFKLELEGIADKATMVDHEHKTARYAKFFHTTNIKPHAVTAGVRGLWLPVFSFVPLPATPLVTYSNDWEVLIRGNATAASFKKDSHNNLDLNNPGSVASAPPICAVRTFGKGRVAVLAADRIYSGQNIGLPSWSHIVENRGFADKPGDLMKLLTQLLKWTAEPSLKAGTVKPLPPSNFKKVEYPAAVNWDDVNFRAPDAKPCRGIIGAHSSFAGGKSTVAEYVAAAKKAGLQFIVFTDPLEKSSAEKIAALKAACQAASDDAFTACPGVEFTDGSGIRWVFFGPKVAWPDEKTFYKDGFPHKLWVDKKIQHYGRYAAQCSYPGSAVLDYSLLQKNNVRAENLWWFFHVIPYAYDQGKLIADNYDFWSFSLRDLRWVVPISFTRITSAQDVAAAADVAVTSARDMDAVRKMLSTRCSGYHAAWQNNQQVAYGKNTPVVIHNFQALNAQADPRILQTRGTQRVKGNFVVSATNGLKEVSVMDGMGGVLRRYDATGAKELSCNFELVHDRQHPLWLEVTDVAGNKAISHKVFLYNYKQGLFRCNDNLNILGPLGYYWHPDRHERLPFFKTFRNAELNSVQGWDRGGADCPVPYGDTLNQMHIEGIGEALPGSPDKKYSMQMKVLLAGNDLQIVDAVMDSIVEGYDSATRPGPASTSPARKLSDNPYFIHTQRMFSPRDRMNHHVAWDHRRLNESLEEYDGSFHYFEGEITFRQDVTLAKNAAVPIELAAIRTEPREAMAAQNDTLLVTDPKNGVTRTEIPRGKKNTITGQIADGGFAALMNSQVGYLALLPVQGDFRYCYQKPGRLVLGIGTPGRTYKAGEKLRYAYISGAFVDSERDGKKIALAGQILRDGRFPLALTTGKLAKQPFALGITAEKNEAAFRLGPLQGLGIDLPICVRGLDDNGCIAVYSSLRPWLRYVGMATDGAVYFQEPLEKENRIWVGNVFLADNKAIKMTLVMDGQEPGREPYLELHNPTDRDITTKVWSPAHTPRFGGNSFTITIPAGSSLFVDTNGRKIRM